MTAAETPTEPVKKTRYRKRYVAFVDILGFASLVQAAERAPTLQTDIIEALRKVRRQPAKSEAAHLRAQTFSDSLIVSASLTPIGLWKLLCTLNQLSWDLLELGVLARGAVTIGGIYHDDEIAFGTGVNDAYRLESTVAKYPRIILARSVVQAADKYASRAEVWKQNRDIWLIRDYDGVVFLHYLNNAVGQSVSVGIIPFFNLFWNGGASRTVQKIIQTKLDETIDAPDVYEKFRWLGNYWNASVPISENKMASTLASPTLSLGLLGMKLRPNLGPVQLAGEGPEGPARKFRHKSLSHPSASKGSAT